jgi:hypothetical protein
MRGMREKSLRQEREKSERGTRGKCENVRTVREKSRTAKNTTTVPNVAPMMPEITIMSSPRRMYDLSSRWPMYLEPRVEMTVPNALEKMNG